MTKISKKLTLVFAIALIATLSTSAPAALAKEGNGKNETKVKVEQKVEAKGSIWSKWFGKWFGARAKAQTETTVNARLTPSISGITAPTVLRTGQTGTWTVRASDPKNGSLSYAVDWGEMRTLEARAQADFVQSSTFTHAYSNPGTYTVKFTVSNEAGLKTISTATVRVIGRPIADAPVITDLKAISDRPHQATITWKTNVASDSSIWYGTSAGVDTSGSADVYRPGKIMNHSIKLTGLTADTTYYVKVGSANGSGTTIVGEISFKTKALVDKEAPVITGLKGPSEVTVGAEVTVMVSAYDPKNDSLSYSVDWGDSASMADSALRAHRPIFSQDTTFSHVYTEAGTYTVTSTVENSLGKKATSSMKITVKADPQAGIDS